MQYISENTINYIKVRYKDFLNEIEEICPVIYVTECILNKYPKFYSGSNYKNKASYLGSSKTLLEDIKKYGIANFKKTIIFKFSNDLTRKELREIESIIQKMEGHRNNPDWYNLTDSTGPGQPKGLYVGKNRTKALKKSDLIKSDYKGGNRTPKQLIRDEIMRNYKGENRTFRQKEYDLIQTYNSLENRKESSRLSDYKKSLRKGENRTRLQKEADEKLKNYKGENRTPRQIIRDKIMCDYTGENRTNAQKLHDIKMKEYKGENRTSAQLIRDNVMRNYRGENRTEAQKYADLLSIEKLGKKIKLINENLEIIESNSIRQLCKIYNLHRTSILKLISFKIEEYKGWRVLKNS